MAPHREDQLSTNVHRYGPSLPPELWHHIIQIHQNNGARQRFQQAQHHLDRNLDFYSERQPQHQHLGIFDRLVYPPRPPGHRPTHTNRAGMSAAAFFGM